MLDGAGYNTACSDKNLLLEVVSAQIKKRPALKDIGWGNDRGGDESDTEDSEDEDSETDGN